MLASTLSMPDPRLVTATQTLPSRVYSLQESNFVDPWYKDLPRDVSIRIPAGTKTDISASSEFFLLTRFPRYTSQALHLPPFQSTHQSTCLG